MIKYYPVWERRIMYYAADILLSPHMQEEKEFIQHGTVSVYEHSLGVTCFCLMIACKLHLKVNKRALVRGALLHDYFLYDWHVPDKSHRLHGFTHAAQALRNAERDFILGDIERDMIQKHMFPLNIYPPKYKESIILCIADKICAACETFTR